MGWIVLEIVIVLSLVGGIIAWLFLPKKKPSAEEDSPD